MRKYSGISERGVIRETILEKRGAEMKSRINILFLFIFAFVIAFPIQVYSGAPVTHLSVLADIMNDPRMEQTSDLRELRGILAENYWYAQAGSYGPDLFNFSQYPRYSYMAHYCLSGKLAKKMLDIAKRDGDPKKIAFACGWLIHVATDMKVHPWVNRVVENEKHLSAGQGQYHNGNEALHRHIELPWETTSCTQMAVGIF